MRNRSAWQRPLAYVAIVSVVAVAYFIGRIGRGVDPEDAAASLGPDPGYAARDAEVIETGYDGRERYRLNASVIRQQTDTGIIELEQLHMNYHPDAQAAQAGEPDVSVPPGEVWHLTSDRGQVRADGDDVLLTGNVEVTGPAPAGGEPLTLVTTELRVNTPTQFIETDAPVKLRWSGHELMARGMEADMKAGTLRLESDVHGRFAQK
jgi:lipopolysaccharide export system protein LptC